jgi:ABC-type branched-subunit amino acid transport system substrate-binding protein
MAFAGASVMHRLVVALGFSLLSSFAAAQIVVGQTAGFSGPEALSAKETTEGAKLYLDHVNEAGGVNGEKIELVTLDDQGNPQKAAQNAAKLITQDNVLALLLTRGVAPTQAVLPVLAQNHVPLVAPVSGAMSLRQPVNPWVFNLRTSAQHEGERAAAHLVHMGMNRIALAYSNDAFGMDARIGALRGFDKAHMRVAFALPYNAAHPDFSQVVLGVSRLDAQAVILIGSGQAVADATRAMRLKGLGATIVTLSNNANAEFVKQMGEFARAAVVTQAFPDEHAQAAGLVKEAYSFANAKGVFELTPDMLEGFAGAKLLVEGLKKAGPKPTRQKLHDALDNLGRVNLGGMEVTYSPKNHEGSDFVDLAIVGPDGKFRR